MNVFKATHQCQICRAPALYSNYGVLTCSACKMFFRRNAKKSLSNRFVCLFNGHCHIDRFNRHQCPACRLSKCFAKGMKIERIQSSISNDKNSLATISRQRFSSLNLLTFDQWTLLSNLIHCYDEYSGLTLMQSFINEQTNLPLKMRFKTDAVGQLSSALFSKSQLLFERNVDFLLLPSHDQSILLRREMKYTVMINVAYIGYRARFLDYPAFYQTAERLFGSRAMAISRDVISLVNVNVPFLKLVLALISFSTSDYTVYHHSPAEVFTDYRRILSVQDRYIELAWKYLVYISDFKHAVIYFSNLIRCLFTIHLFIVNSEETGTYTSMIDTLVDETERKLIVDI